MFFPNKTIWSCHLLITYPWWLPWHKALTEHINLLIVGTYAILCPHLSSCYVSHSMPLPHWATYIFLNVSRSHLQSCTWLLPLSAISLSLSFFLLLSFFRLSRCIILNIKCQNIPASGSLCWHPKASLGKSFLCFLNVLFTSLLELASVHRVNCLFTYLTPTLDLCA